MEIKRNARRSARGLWLGVVVASGLIIVTLAAPVVANDDGTTSHLWNDHIKLMKQPCTINSDSNPVHWSKLKGVPVGLADGIDDGVEAAGFGLNKAATPFGPIYSVDPTQIQRRVIGGCGPGRAIREIVEDGRIDCDPVSQGLATTDNDTGTICVTSYCTEGSLTLDVGTWAISAKITLEQPDLDDDVEGDCVLGAGGPFGGLGDRATFRGDAGSVTLSMQGVATLVQGGNLNASVRCRVYFQGPHGHDLSIMAIRVGG